jgi:hypothetical protein
MAYIKLMSRYPKTTRDSLLGRVGELSDEEKAISKAFSKEYFDGDRRFGLGGYYYDPRFFGPVVEDFIRYYGIKPGDRILDVGSAKGFMLFDFMRLAPGILVAGIDISEYCYDNAISTVRPFLSIGSCDKLPFPARSFDYVFSIATIHNLDRDGIRRSLREIVRVTRKGAFIKVNGYANDEERRRINAWNIVASEPLSVDEWLAIFEETGYVYDYEFFVP